MIIPFIIPLQKRWGRFGGGSSSHSSGLGSSSHSSGLGSSSSYRGGSGTAVGGAAGAGAYAAHAHGGGSNGNEDDGDWDRRWLLMLLILVPIILLFIYLWYRSRKRKQRARDMEQSAQTGVYDHNSPYTVNGDYGDYGGYNTNTTINGNSKEVGTPQAKDGVVKTAGLNEFNNFERPTGLPPPPAYLGD